MRASTLAGVLAVGLASPASAASFLFVASDAGSTATVAVFADRDENDTFETLAFQTQPLGVFKGGLRLAAGDFDGDGNDELAIGVGRKGGGRVDIYDVVPDGSLGERLDSFFAFSEGFRSGVYVAAGDLEGDGRDELVVSGDVKSESLVRIYSDADRDGLLSDDLREEFAPFGPGFSGGAVVALGDINNALGDELAVGHGPGGASRVLVFHDTDLDGSMADETAAEDFDAFEDGYKGGVNLAAGRLESTGGNGAELIVSAAKKLADVLIMTDLDADGLVSDDGVAQTLAAYAKSRGGVRVAMEDTDGSGSLVELVTVPGKGAPAALRIFDDTLDAGFELDPVPVDEIVHFAPSFKKGSFVAAGKVRSGAYVLEGPPRPIPDLASLSVSIFVPTGAGALRDGDVFLAIQHTFDADLDVSLTHVPSGTTVALFTDVGNNDDGFVVRLNDEAGVDIGTAPDDANDRAVMGTFNPEGAELLSSFDGLDASGEWRLTLTDDVGLFTGVLHAFELHFTF
jgi:subtilisin-like proprotein convertase family protein